VTIEGFAGCGGNEVCQMTGPIAISDFYVQQEGAYVIREHGAASPHEKVYVFLRLHATETVGQFTLRLLLDGYEQSVSIHTAMGAGETDEMWFQCGPLGLGHYRLAIACAPVDEDGWEPVGAEIGLDVVDMHHGAVPEGSY
jgi:hypothetical protein